VVFKLAVRLLRSRDEAEDAMQETFLKAWEARAGFRGESGVRTWLCRIALNHCYRALKRGRRRAPLEQAAAAHAAGPGAHPDADAERARLREAIDRAVAELPPDWQAALTLREALGFSYEEMSQAMGCPLGTAKSRLFRARAALREKLASTWGVEAARR
jgi:RNA polymerase sigma-70 factor (ECF subfamily)